MSVPQRAFAAQLASVLLPAVRAILTPDVSRTAEAPTAASTTPSSPAATGVAAPFDEHKVTQASSSIGSSTVRLLFAKRVVVVLIVLRDHDTFTSVDKVRVELATHTG